MNFWALILASKSGRHDGLTRQRHDELGAALHAEREQLAKLYVEVGNAYPLQDRHAKKVMLALQRALAQIDRARSNLEELYARQHPDTWQSCTYYPGPTNAGD